MALDVKRGTFVLASTDTGTKSVTGLGFTPKAVILWVSKAGADETWTADFAWGIGFMTDSEQGTCFFNDRENGGTSDVGGGSSTAAALQFQLDNVPTLDFSLTKPGSPFSSGQFDLTISDQAAANRIIHYIALGGSDITDAFVGSFLNSMTSTNATQDVAIASFGQPDLIFFATNHIGSGTDPLLGAAFGGIGFGVAASDTLSHAISYAQDDGEAAMDCGCFNAARALHVLRDAAAPATDLELELDAKANWPANGFRMISPVNGTAQTNHRIFYLALKGTFSKTVGLTNSPTADGNVDIDAGFTPKLALFMTDGLAGHDSMDTASADNVALSLGAYDGASQGCIVGLQDDGNTNCISWSFSDADKSLRMEPPSDTHTNRGLATASFPGGNTVRTAWTGVGATARRFGYLVLGDAPAAPTPKVVRPVAVTKVAVQRAAMR